MVEEQKNGQREGGVVREAGTRSRHGGSTGLKASNRLRRAWREAKVEVKSRGNRAGNGKRKTKKEER